MFAPSCKSSFHHVLSVLLCYLRGAQTARQPDALFHSTHTIADFSESRGTSGGPPVSTHFVGDLWPNVTKRLPMEVSGRGGLLMARVPGSSLELGVRRASSRDEEFCCCIEGACKAEYGEQLFEFPANPAESRQKDYCCKVVQGDCIEQSRSLGGWLRSLGGWSKDKKLFNKEPSLVHSLMNHWTCLLECKASPRYDFGCGRVGRGELERVSTGQGIQHQACECKCSEEGFDPEYECQTCLPGFQMRDRKKGDPAMIGSGAKFRRDGVCVVETPPEECGEGEHAGAEKCPSKEEVCDSFGRARHELSTWYDTPKGLRITLQCLDRGSEESQGNELVATTKGYLRNLYEKYSGAAAKPGQGPWDVFWNVQAKWLVFQDIQSGRYREELKAAGKAGFDLPKEGGDPNVAKEGGDPNVAKKGGDPKDLKAIEEQERSVLAAWAKTQPFSFLREFTTKYLKGGAELVEAKDGRGEGSSAFPGWLKVYKDKRYEILIKNEFSSLTTISYDELAWDPQRKQWRTVKDMGQFFEGTEFEKRATYFPKVVIRGTIGRDEEFIDDYKQWPGRPKLGYVFTRVKGGTYGLSYGAERDPTPPKCLQKGTGTKIEQLPRESPACAQDWPNEEKCNAMENCQFGFDTYFSVMQSKKLRETGANDIVTGYEFYAVDDLMKWGPYVVDLPGEGHGCYKWECIGDLT